MKDRILESYLQDFSKEYILSALNESELFEHFVNYCIVAREHSESFDFEEIHVGGSGDNAIDGMAILVNEHLVSSTEGIDFFKNSLRRLDAQFIFLQSKTSSNFDMGEIGKFIFGVKSFFEETPAIRVNSQIRHLRSLKEYIYNSSIDMDRSPLCHMYYVTTGKWVEDDNLVGLIKSGIDDLKQTDLFSEVEFFPIDSENMRRMYRELRHKVEKEIIFEKHTILPPMDNVQEAYLGILPSEEFLKLVCDDEGNLRRSIFYDNVRDFQGNNPVNREIAESINSPDQSDKFALLNNGITIVAKSINKVGDKFKLMDYQIVNGGQTSHVLYRNRDSLTNKVLLPIKLIVTNDVEVTNRIIKATNRQTEVKIEAFESLTPFQKTLEEFYSSFGKDKEPRLYYERRSKQYDNLPIKKNQIISLAAQVKCFLAMFLNEPHSTHRYYGELLKANRNRMFVGSPHPYYISGYGLNRLERFFNENKIDHFYKKFRYQMLMLFRIFAEISQLPYLNSKKIDSYCVNLLENLTDEDRALDLFKKCAAVINKTLAKVEVDPRAATRLKIFTNELISQAPISKAATVATVEREQGTVIWFSAVKGYGFIRSRQREDDIFVHSNDVSELDYVDFRTSQLVEFSVTEGDRGLKAYDVQILK